METESLSDIHALAELQLPAELKFFDCLGTNGLNFACALFDVKGFTIDLLHLDVMHIVDLGVAQYLVAAVFRRLIENNVGGSERGNVGLIRAEGVKWLRRRMLAYYKTRPKTRGKQSAIGKLTEPMLGPVNNPRLKAKAAETRNLCPLLVELCAEHRGLLGEGALHLRICCTEINSFYDVLQRGPRRMTAWLAFLAILRVPFHEPLAILCWPLCFQTPPVSLGRAGSRSWQS